jgi:hypothetical protein
MSYVFLTTFLNSVGNYKHPPKTQLIGRVFVSSLSNLLANENIFLKLI